MSDNVGLSTPRGSGTSGFVQRNRAFIRPRDNAYATPSNPREFLAAQQKQQLSGRPREPDQGILEHDRKRAIEVRVFALRDELEEKGELDDDAIDEQCDELRKKLTAEAQRNGGSINDNGGGRQRFKAHQVHEQARAKQIESERLRRALRINKDYEEGGHWRRQEERQALKRKKDDDDDDADANNSAAAVEPQRKGRDADKRRRRYSDESDGGYSSYEEGEIGRSGGRRSPPPLKSIERVGGSGDDRPRERTADARGRGPQRTADSRSPLPPQPRSVSESRSRSRSRSVRSRSRSLSQTPSRGPSRSRSRSRSAARVQGRRRSPSYSRSPSQTSGRSRRASRDSRS